MYEIWRPRWCMQTNEKSEQSFKQFKSDVFLNTRAKRRWTGKEAVAGQFMSFGRSSEKAPGTAWMKKNATKFPFLEGEIPPPVTSPRINEAAKPEGDALTVMDLSPFDESKLGYNTRNNRFRPDPNFASKWVPKHENPKPINCKWTPDRASSSQKISEVGLCDGAELSFVKVYQYIG